jgi:hypothetical protein
MPVMRSILARFTRFVAFAGLAAYAAGSVFSLYIVDAETFQRFGALGVAAAFLFFTDRLTKIELGRQRSVERLLHEYGVELAALRQGKPATEIPLEGFAVDFLTEERNFDRLRRQADWFNAANVVLITAATLQWGFGDRWVNNLVVCGAPSC